MDQELYLILNEILNSHREIAALKSEKDFLNLIHKKPPFYYMKKENIIGTFLDNAVKRYGNVENVAEECGVSSETIKKTRNGTRFPSKILWIKIAAALKIRPEYIDIFMMAAGYSLNTLYREDVFFYYGLLNGMTCKEIYYLLKIFIDEETANSFLSP